MKSGFFRATIYNHRNLFNPIILPLASLKKLFFKISRMEWDLQKMLKQTLLVNSIILSTMGHFICHYATSHLTLNFQKKLSQKKLLPHSQTKKSCSCMNKIKKSLAHFQCIYKLYALCSVRTIWFFPYRPMSIIMDKPNFYIGWYR